MSDHCHCDENDISRKQIKEYLQVFLICYFISDFAVNLLNQYIHYDSCAESVSKSFFTLNDVAIFD